MNKEELEVKFDTSKNLYYVEKKVTLKPGETYTLQVHSLAVATLLVWRGRIAREYQEQVGSPASSPRSFWRTSLAACFQPEQL